jgi:mRNA interferase RelE/StbE
LAWKIEYAGTARKQLRNPDKAMARRILDFMDERVAASDDPRLAGKALRAC